MKLYYAKGTCSFAPHVGLREAGLDFELAAVDLREKTLADGGDYLAVNPRGYVPLLERDDGTRLAECAVILQWIGDRMPESGLAPAAGTEERYQVQEWLSFTGGELHKGLPMLFLPYVPDAMRPVARARLETRLGFLDGALEGREWLMGETFTIADVYCGAILNWSKPAKYDLGQHPNVAAFHERFCARDSVKAAHAAEEAAG